MTRRTDELQSFFTSVHLPPHLQNVAEYVEHLVDSMLRVLPNDSAELTAGLRHLLEAKDCFVRAALLDARRNETEGGE